MFESAGMENPKLGTVIVGILKIVFTFITIFIMNRFRRKLLMQVSLGIETQNEKTDLSKTNKGDLLIFY